MNGPHYHHDATNLAVVCVIAQSSQVARKEGALIVDDGNHPLGMGAKKYPLSMGDSEPIPAEIDALLHSVVNVQGCTMYLTHWPTLATLMLIIHAGITRLVIPTKAEPADSDQPAQFMEIMKSCGVEFVKLASDDVYEILLGAGTIGELAVAGGFRESCTVGNCPK